MSQQKTASLGHPGEWPPPAAWVHCLRVQVTEADRSEGLFTRLAGALGALLEPRARELDSKLPELCVEQYPFASSSAIAGRLRESEMARPLSRRSTALCRLVLIRFADAVSDLIIAADRSVLDRQGMTSIARTLATTGGWRCRGAPPSEAAFTTAAGTPNYRSRLCGAPLEAPVLLAASAYVAGKLTGHSHLCVLPVAQWSMAPGEIEWTLEANPATRTVLEYVRWIGEQMGQDLPGRMAAEATAASLRPEQGAIVGVLWEPPADDESDELTGARYRACLAAPFPLTLYCGPSSDGGVDVAYCCDPVRFDPAAIETYDEALGAVYEAFRNAVQAGADRAMAALPLLDRERAAGAISTGGDLAGDHWSAARIDQALAGVAAAQPGAVALSYAEDSMTYAELDRLGNQLARSLAELGVCAGARVGVCLERGLELVPVLLGIIRAGGAYVPMDSTLPAERIAFISMDADVALLISSAHRPGVSQPQTTLAALLDLAAGVPDTPMPAAGSAADAAYIIYTSGSTGRPKGVIVPHRNVAALIEATRAEFELQSSDTWTLFHSVGFDFSVWEIWGCLCTGGHLLIVPYWVSRTPDELLPLLQRARVSVLNLTPSALAQIQDADRRAQAHLPDLRLVILGGEPLDCATLVHWFDRHPESECRVVNMYGITETTVHVTAETITRKHALTRSRSVGRPICGWHLYIMDEEGRVLPCGVVGEIYVGGAGVAAGYLNRPELTAQRFVPDPFGAGLVYRSGDQGRLLPDGRLEHLGRLDAQVKIRGFRVEPDEIRAVLLQHPNVAAAGVFVGRIQPDDPASARIDAYVVIDCAEVSDVRRHARSWLPEHMVPNTITAVAELPLTVNGKLDVQKLRAVATAAVRSEEALEAAPSTAPTSLEAQLQSIWTDVLGVRCGVHDNFFEQGGNSLQAVRIVTAMRQANLPGLQLRELYLRQTIHGIAQYLHQQPVPDRRVKHAAPPSTAEN
jgi:amino acid adenylation domain-containing protein